MFEDEIAASVTAFLAVYGFKILGGVIILTVGIRVAMWLGGAVTRILERRGIDITFARFLGHAAKLGSIGLVVMITLAMVGITIAPLVALVGAGAFGVTLAVQGPLSNYGAGLVIIVVRPFVVGDTVRVQGCFGIVEEISLGATVLVGHDDERITIPNKKILGEVFVNSKQHRVAESRVFLGHDTDPERAIQAVAAALAELDGVDRHQVGIDGFFFGGVILGTRCWVLTAEYPVARYAINAATHRALAAAGIELAVPDAASLAAAAMLGAPDAYAEGDDDPEPGPLGAG